MVVLRSVELSCLAGAVLLVVFVFVELRTERPLVDLRLLQGRLFRSTNMVLFLSMAAFLGMLYLIPLYFQDARGMTALQSGLSTFPEAFGVMIGAQFASRTHLSLHRVRGGTSPAACSAWPPACSR